MRPDYSFDWFSLSFVASAILLLSFQSLALPPTGVGNLGRVIQATNPKFGKAVLNNMDVGCGAQSVDASLATMWAQLRTDVRYLNPTAKDCGIKAATPEFVAHLSGTGVLNSGFSGMATANLVWTSGVLPTLDRRLIVTNAHAFAKNEGTPGQQFVRLDSRGRPLDGPFKFYLEACNKEYEVERVKLGGTNLDKKNDFAFAILKEPVCSAADPYTVEPVGTKDLRHLLGRGTFGLATRQLEGDVCQRSRDGSRFVQPTKGRRSSADAKLHLAYGELIGAGMATDATDPAVAFNMDLVSGGSGGGLFANMNSRQKRLVGIAVGDGKDKTENLGIIFNQKIVDQLRQFAASH